MKALHTILAGAALSLALAAGPLTPAFAQDTTTDTTVPAPTAAPAETTAPAAPTPDAPAPTETAPVDTAPADPALTTAPIDFGDDTSQWANDGECDDPRFAGIGSATELLEADMGHDAADCSAAFAEGSVTLLDPDAVAALIAAGPTDIDFGDDASEWAKDGECDDPRFTGPASASELLEVDRLHDATDCRTAYADGRVTLVDTAPASQQATGPSGSSRIDFGDDSGKWANDGECDDPDFAGPGMTAKPTVEGRKADASDCRAAFDLGTVWLGTATATGTISFDYGSDSSQWANDGECDDPRFTGPGTNKKLLEEDTMADASDCRALEADGSVTIRTIYSPAYIAGAPYDTSGIEFGDDASEYAHDDECDDPRFEGPGAAGYQIDSDNGHDASDCRAAYEAGTVLMRDNV